MHILTRIKFILLILIFSDEALTLQRSTVYLRSRPFSNNAVFNKDGHLVSYPYWHNDLDRYKVFHNFIDYRVKHIDSCYDLLYSQYGSYNDGSILNTTYIAHVEIPVVKLISDSLKAKRFDVFYNHTHYEDLQYQWNLCSYPVLMQKSEVYISHIIIEIVCCATCKFIAQKSSNSSDGLKFEPCNSIANLIDLNFDQYYSFDASVELTFGFRADYYSETPIIRVTTNYVLSGHIMDNIYVLTNVYEKNPSLNLNTKNKEYCEVHDVELYLRDKLYEHQVPEVGIRNLDPCSDLHRN